MDRTVRVKRVRYFTDWLCSLCAQMRPAKERALLVNDRAIACELCGRAIASASLNWPDHTTVDLGGEGSP